MAFAQGHCPRGNECSFSHDPNQARDPRQRGGPNTGVRDNSISSNSSHSSAETGPSYIPQYNPGPSNYNPYHQQQSYPGSPVYS